MENAIYEKHQVCNLSALRGGTPDGTSVLSLSPGHSSGRPGYCFWHGSRCQRRNVIAGAAITLTDTASQTQREATSDSHGFFSFTALPAATYEVKFNKKDFAELRRTIVVHIADHLEIPDIKLAVSAASQLMTVTGEAVNATPDDTGELSYTLTSKQVQNLDIMGRSATELLGLVPGAADSGNFNTDSYSGQVAGFTPNASAYSVNGNRFDLTQIVSDGVPVTDVNTAGAAAVTPNIEMIQEVKVETAAFSSEQPNGPIVLQTETKSGGKDFHGELYATARNHVLDDTDWRVKNLRLPSPDDSYYYLGANIGGPVIIPGTSFNEKRRQALLLRCVREESTACAGPGERHSRSSHSLGWLRRRWLTHTQHAGRRLQRYRVHE